MRNSKTKNILGVLLLISLNFEIALAQPLNKKRRALIIGLDGTAGQVLDRRVWRDKKAPALHEIMSTGKYTNCIHDQDDQCARAHSGPLFDVDFYWKTGPGWTSVVTGVDSLRHGVKYNDDKSLRAFSESSKSFPSFFKRAKDAGLKTAAAGVGAFVSGPGKKKPYWGAIDYECGYRDVGPNVDLDAKSSCNLDYRVSFPMQDPDRDAMTAAAVIGYINNSAVDIIMGHFDHIDGTGHDKGFDENKSYLKAISTTDALIDRVMRALKSRAARENEEWLVVVTADHGGHRIALWGDHGRFANRDNAIPFAVSLFGSDTRLGDLKYPVTHMDVHPTVMHWFGISSPQVDGKVQALP